MILHDEIYYEGRRPIEDLGPLKNCLRFIWDGKRRAFLDRTASDWASVGLFYLFFFGVLFSVFSIQLYITLNILSGSDRPYSQRAYKIDSIESRINQQPFPYFNTPGLGLTPNIQLSTVSPIIWLGQGKDKGNPDKYINEITGFLKDYDRNLSNYNVECDEMLLMNNLKKPCYFDVKRLGKCSRKPYGYSQPYQPCVYIKLNKKFDWIPVWYNRTSDLPEDMPVDLKILVKKTDMPHVWLSCDGATNSDKEHIGIIKYFPHGFPVNYFPFTGRDQYLSPIVALKFQNITNNRLITVKCSSWVQNINHDQMYILDFQIFIT